MINVGQRVGVVGAGAMGAGIAFICAAAGHPVTIAEVDAASHSAARERLRGMAGKRRAHLPPGKVSEPDDVLLERIGLVTDIGELPEDCALVVEAVPESLELKRLVLAQIAATMSHGCVIATNTSALSIAGLSESVTSPGRFLGLHFFNPVPASLLVEVVVGPATDGGVVDATVEWVERLERTAVVVRDSPGFATSRLGVLLGIEAIRMLDEGVADAAAIDDAMRLGYRHAMGPLRATDIVGLDVRLAIAESLSATLGPRFEPPQLLREMVARGDLGRKSGRGFYVWNDAATGRD